MREFIVIEKQSTAQDYLAPNKRMIPPTSDWGKPQKTYPICILAENWTKHLQNKIRSGI